MCLGHQGEVESRHLACGQLGDPAGAGPTVEALEGVIVEGTEIQSIQDVQRSELRETNRRSREIRRRGWPAVFLVVRGAGRNLRAASRR